VSTETFFRSHFTEIAPYAKNKK